MTRKTQEKTTEETCLKKRLRRALLSKAGNERAPARRLDQGNEDKGSGRQGGSSRSSAAMDAGPNIFCVLRTNDARAPTNTLRLSLIRGADL